jgi:hypothetical protein
MLELPSRTPELPGCISWWHPTGEDAFVLGVAAGPSSTDLAQVKIALAATAARYAKENPAMQGSLSRQVSRRVALSYDPRDAAQPRLLFIGQLIGNVGQLCNDLHVSIETAELAAQSIAASPDEPEKVYSRKVRALYGRPYALMPSLRSDTAWWRILDANTAAATRFGRALQRQLLVEHQGPDHELHKQQTVRAARRADIAPELLDEVHEAIVDQIFNGCPLLGKLCENFNSDLSQPTRIACVLTRHWGGDAPRHRLEAAVALELMNLAFHDDVIQRGDLAPNKGSASNPFVVAAGSHLAAEAYRVFARLGPHIAKLAGKVTQLCVRGRLRSLNMSGFDWPVFLQSRREAVGEIYAFAALLALSTSEAELDLNCPQARAASELGTLSSIVEEVEDLRLYAARKPIARWAYHANLPRMASFLLQFDASSDTANLYAAASVGDGGAAAQLCHQLVCCEPFRTEAARVIHQQLAALEAAALPLGRMGMTLIGFGQDAVERGLGPLAKS